VPLSLKGTQRGDVYLEMTFFAAGPAPALNRRPSKFTNPAERLARPQQPVAQRPQRLVSQPLPSSLAPGSPGGQAQRPNSNEGNRLGRSKIQQVPLPGPWPGPSAQQRQSTLPSASSQPMRRSSKGEDAPLPPLPPDAQQPREEFVPSILRPGGPSRMGIAGAPSPPIPNGTTGHHHATQNDSSANTAYPPRHHTVNQSMPPFPGSPVPQAHVRTSSPQPQPQPPPPTQPHSSHLASYSTQGTVEHVGGYSQGGHTATQPFSQAQPDVSHTQYRSQSHTPPQLHQQVQHSTWQPAQPQGGPPPHLGSPYPTDNHQAHPYHPTTGPPSPGQSYVAASSPKPPPQPYTASQIASPPVPSHITAQSPPPVPHAWPYAANTSPVPSARPHSSSPSPGIHPPTHQYIPPTQPYALSPPPSAPSYAAPMNSVPLAQSYSPPMGPVLSPPPQSAAPSSHVPPYYSTPNSAFPLPTSPPPVPPHSPTYAHPPAPSFPVPSFPVPQTSGYFEPAPPAPFSPPPEPDFPDPYLRRRYEAPLPLPQGTTFHPPHTSPGRRPEPTNPPLAAAASSRQRAETEDERAAREWQRWEEEDARARREQEEKDEELARTLDLELNMGGSGNGGAQNEHGRRTSHSQLPSLSTGVVRNSSGDW
jgi:hypothetical protein